MLLSDFQYELPAELIAQHPLADRAAARMLVMNRATGACELRNFHEFPEFVRPGDCLVLNDTKVIPARLRGMRGAAKIETMLIEPGEGARPGKTAAAD